MGISRMTKHIQGGCASNQRREAFKVFRAVAENESRRKIREIMMENTLKLLMGEMCDIGKYDSTKLRTMIPYHPTPNSVAE